MKKLVIISIMLLVGIGAAIVVILAATAPSGKSPEQIAHERALLEAEKEKENGKQTVSTEELRMRNYEKRLGDIEHNIRTLYDNQLKMNKTVTDLVSNEDALRKAQKENRAYIASIYQKTLNLELQIGSLGGGFSNPSRPRTTIQSDPIPDPLMGTDKLPDSSLLPPVPITPAVPVAPSGASAPIQNRLPEP
jgi:flagellar basal body-associated protein FliL